MPQGRPCASSHLASTPASRWSIPASCLMKGPSSSWLVAGGASQEVLRELQAEIGPLPPSYLALLAIGNGGEVGLSVSPLVLCVDSAQVALDYWRSGTYTMSGVFVFGGNGGGCLLAFDLRQAGEWPVVAFDPIDPEGSIEAVAPDFDGLLALIETP